MKEKVKNIFKRKTAKGQVINLYRKKDVQVRVIAGAIVGAVVGAAVTYKALY